ncbi:NEK2 kinase, partial [Polypterus senegalus]
MTESEKQMLVSEVNLLRELRHPNIVRYYDRIIDRTNTTLYIVMEHCEGGDLASLITRCIKERKYLDEEFIIKVLAQLSMALKECHRRSDGGHVVLHRDLKPANIFLDYKQNVKLGDFGLARILNHDTSFAKTFVGTPYYMSPVSMIWPPFTAYNQKDLAEKIREGKFRRIPYRYSEGLNTLITRMLNLKDYLRPSVEAIIQNSLIAGIVADEQKNYEKTRRKSSDYEKPLPSESSASELKLKEQQLQEREQALKEREERLEQREHELCLRERLCEDKLERTTKEKVVDGLREGRSKEEKGIEQGHVEQTGVEEAGSIRTPYVKVGQAEEEKEEESVVQPHYLKNSILAFAMI